jgi:hypothetical protein
MRPFVAVCCLSYVQRTLPGLCPIEWRGSEKVHRSFWSVLPFNPSITGEEFLYMLSFVSQFLECFSSQTLAVLLARGYRSAQELTSLSFRRSPPWIATSSHASPSAPSLVFGRFRRHGELVLFPYGCKPARLAPLVSPLRKGRHRFLSSAPNTPGNPPAHSVLANSDTKAPGALDANTYFLRGSNEYLSRIYASHAYPSQHA